MELVIGIGAGVVLLVAVVLLFGAKAEPRTEAADESDQDETNRTIVDIAPPGSGGGT